MTREWDLDEGGDAIEEALTYCPQEYADRARAAIDALIKKAGEVVDPDPDVAADITYLRNAHGRSDGGEAYPYTEPIVHHQPPCTSQEECFRRVIEDARAGATRASSACLHAGCHPGRCAYATGAELLAEDRAERAYRLGEREVFVTTDKDHRLHFQDASPAPWCLQCREREQHKRHYVVTEYPRAVELVSRATARVPIGDGHFLGLLAQLVFNPDNHLAIVVWLENLERESSDGKNTG